MIELRTAQKKLIRDLLVGLVRRSSIKVLERKGATAKDIQDWWFGDVDASAWRVQEVDKNYDEIMEILGYKPAKKKGKKKNG